MEINFTIGKSYEISPVEAIDQSPTGEMDTWQNVIFIHKTWSIFFKAQGI
jgi:hypothetical protein